jgi:hypothetical protein
MKDGVGGGRKNYCPECAESILARVELDVLALRSTLRS